MIYISQLPMTGDGGDRVSITTLLMKNSKTLTFFDYLTGSET